MTFPIKRVKITNMETIDIKKYRQNVGKTQAKCAEELGITVVYFSDLERGVFQPGAPLALKIEEWSEYNIDRATLRPDIWKSK